MPIHRVSSGTQGLDEILDGGFPEKHAYLLQGEAGTGKTTLAFQFLMAGVRRGEKALYISILQSDEQIEEMAASHGWDISGIDREMLVDEALNEARFKEQNLLPSSEVQLNEVMTAVRKAVQRQRPNLVVFDSIEQFRLITGDQMTYQQKTMELLQLFEQVRATSLFVHTTEERSGFKTLAHGVICLQMELPVMGGLQRYIHIEKMRSIAFKGGRYPFRIRRGGIEIYPPLPAEPRDDAESDTPLITSGVARLDTMLAGGLAPGTATLFAGASGTGKSSLATLYACESARQGRRAVIFLFDERENTLLQRARGMGMDIDTSIDRGTLELVQVNIGDLSVGQLAHMMRREVEELDTKMIVIDSIAGFFSSMPGQSQLMAHLHEMLSYLAARQVSSFMVLTEHGMFSEVQGEVDISYISDSVIILRRFEAMGEIKLAISVLKKRIGGHEKSIRELQITDEGIKVGEPLRDFEGVLTGHPRYRGNPNNLMG